MQYAVIDLETTGLYPYGHDRVIEIAIVGLGNDLTICSEFDSLVNPGRDLGPTWLHGIETRDVLNAPAFMDLAGTIADQLAGTLIVGHNVLFDCRFLDSEFARGGVEIPGLSFVDTLQLALSMGSPSRRLEEACELFGIDLTEGHSALADAKATAKLFGRCVSHAGPEQIRNFVRDSKLTSETTWPKVETRQKPLPRKRATQRSRHEESFVGTLVSHLPASQDEPGNWQSYYALLDRALEDRRITSEEAVALTQEALAAGLSEGDVKSANEAYLEKLINIALKDDKLSESETRDISEVARLLGLEQELERLLEAGSSVRDDGHKNETAGIPLEGRTVCFTGALNASIKGERATREKATEVAIAHGMSVAKGVTKKLDYLVMSDPDSLSGKARKARAYGTRILAESVFWHLVGIDTDD